MTFWKFCNENPLVALLVAVALLLTVSEVAHALIAQGAAR